MKFIDLLKKDVDEIKILTNNYKRGWLSQSHFVSWGIERK